MPNGKPGDDPITDMLVHGLHPFPADIEAMLREVFSIDPGFPEGKRRYTEQCEWMKNIQQWSRGEQLDEGRVALRELLEYLRTFK
jgi:hypothetical protein